jgi:hypothetical protein
LTSLLRALLLVFHRLRLETLKGLLRLRAQTARDAASN